MNIFDLDESLRDKNPCWKGYHTIGTKKKDGRTVPNCVPESEQGVEEAVSKQPQVGNDVIMRRRGGVPGIIVAANSDGSFTVRDEQEQDHVLAADQFIITSYNTTVPKYVGRVPEEVNTVDEGKWFQTTYGWAGGEKPGGGKYLHPEIVAQRRREKAKKKREQERQAKFGTKPTDIPNGVKDVEEARGKNDGNLGGPPIASGNAARRMSADRIERELARGIKRSPWPLWVVKRNIERAKHGLGPIFPKKKEVEKVEQDIAEGFGNRQHFKNLDKWQQTTGQAWGNGRVRIEQVSPGTYSARLLNDYLVGVFDEGQGGWLETPRHDMAESDISGILGAASLVKDYTITAEVDGKVKKFRIRGVTGPRAAKERFLKHASTAKILDVKEVGEQGLAEGQSNEFTVADFKINAFESMSDFRRWMQSPKTDKRGMTRYHVGHYSGILINESALLEADKIFSKRKQEAKQFSDSFKQLDQRDQVKIKVGNKLSILSATIVPGDSKMTSRVEMSGFVNPKKITKINSDMVGKIDSIEFDDGSTFPESSEFTTVGGVNISNTIFFPDSKSASEAYTHIWMLTSGLEGNGWKIESYTAEGSKENKDQETIAALNKKPGISEDNKPPLVSDHDLARLYRFADSNLEYYKHIPAPKKYKVLATDLVNNSLGNAGAGPDTIEYAKQKIVDYLAKVNQRGVAEGVTSPEIKQAYDAIMKTPPRTPARRAAIREYQRLRAKALEKKRQGVAETKPVAHSIDYAIWSKKSPDEQRMLKQLHPDLKIKNVPPKSRPEQVKKPTIDYATIARKAENVLGNTFPDGDPVDWLYPYLERMGIPQDKQFKVLDRAIRLHVDKKGYHHWLESSWDSIADDNIMPDIVTRENNPWRVSESVKTTVTENTGTIDLIFLDGTKRFMRTGDLPANSVKTALSYMVRNRDFDSLKKLKSVDGHDVTGLIKKLFAGSDKSGS